MYGGPDRAARPLRWFRGVAKVWQGILVPPWEATSSAIVLLVVLLVVVRLAWRSGQNETVTFMSRRRDGGEGSDL